MSEHRGAYYSYVNSLPATVVFWLHLQTVWAQLKLDKISGLIWNQGIWHSDGIPEGFFKELNFENTQQTTKNDENFPACSSIISKMCVGSYSTGLAI